MIRRIYIRSLLVLAMLLHGMIASALPHQYYQFNNLKGMTQKLCVRNMVQTEDGIMWFGTEDGLYSYNGYHLRRHDLNSISAGPLNYMAAVGDSILIGGERGLLSFNLHTYTFRQLPYIQDETVKGIVWAAGHWWVATEDAIYQDGKRMGLSLGTIFSIGCDDTYLYIGTREQVLRYDFRKYTLEALDDNVWIATCFAPSDHGRVWIGMATAVVEWDWAKAAATFRRAVPGRHYTHHRREHGRLGTQRQHAEPEERHQHQSTLPPHQGTDGHAGGGLHPRPAVEEGCIAAGYG